MIQGKNIIIRPLELGDEEILHKWWNDNNVMGHSTNAFGTMQSKETIKASILRELSDTNMFPPRKRFMICKMIPLQEGYSGEVLQQPLQVTQKYILLPIGEINYTNWDSRNQKAEFGIKICELDEQGKGYGIDALYHFIDFMFRFLNLNKIELTTMIDNTRAQNLYKKLGFKDIGIIRDGYFDSRYGRFSSIVYMDLLKSEWEEIKFKIKI